VTSPAAIPRLEALQADLADADTSAQLLKICESAIAEWQTVIAEIEASGQPRADKRRALWNARSQLGELECAAERLRLDLRPEGAA